MNFPRLLLIKGLGCLPLAWVRGLGSLIGRLSWLVQTRLATTTSVNLAICYPQLSSRERHALAKQSLMETSKTALEACLVWQKNWEWLRERLLVREGEALLDSKLAKGKGLLVLAPHLGNWEILSPYMSDFARLTALYQPIKNTAINDYILARRSRRNAQMVPTDSRGVKEVIRALRRGEIVIVLPDQVPDRGTGGQLSQFFGHPALTMTLIHGLIQRTGCEVCISYVERFEQGFKTWVLEADEAIFSQGLQQSVDALNASLEACVRRLPSQYQWEYKRFRRLPEPYINPYRK